MGFLGDKYKNSGFGKSVYRHSQTYNRQTYKSYKKSGKGIKKATIASFIAEEKISKRSQRIVHEY